MLLANARIRTGRQVEFNYDKSKWQSFILTGATSLIKKMRSSSKKYVEICLLILAARAGFARVKLR